MAGVDVLDCGLAGVAIRAAPLAGVAGVTAAFPVVAGVVPAIPGLVVAAAALIFVAVSSAGVAAADVVAGAGASRFALFASGLATVVPSGMRPAAAAPVDPVVPGLASASFFAASALTEGSEVMGLVPTESELVVESSVRSFFGSRSDMSVMTGIGTWLWLSPVSTCAGMSYSGLSSAGRGVGALSYDAERSGKSAGYWRRRCSVLEEAPPFGSDEPAPVVSVVFSPSIFSSSAATYELEGAVPAGETVSVGASFFSRLSTLIPLDSASSTVI